MYLVFVVTSVRQIIFSPWKVSLWWEYSLF